MIHSLVPVPASYSATVSAPPLSSFWGFIHLTWWFEPYPFEEPVLADPTIFRWEQPVDAKDSVSGFIGCDTFWHPGSLKTQSFRGVTSPFFVRDGRGPIPPDISGEGDE